MKPLPALDRNCLWNVSNKFIAEKSAKITKIRLFSPRVLSFFAASPF